MPRITRNPVVAYAHCTNMLCEGYSQVQVSAVMELSEVTIGERDPKAGIFAPIVETSWQDLAWADGEDARCEHCHGTRELSATPRPTYQSISGHPQDGLLTMRGGFDPNTRNTEADQQAAAALAEQTRQMAEMREQIAALTAAVTAPAEAP